MLNKSLRDGLMPYSSMRRRPSRGLRYITGRIPSSQCTHWCRSAKRVMLEDDTRLVCLSAHVKLSGYIYLYFLIITCCLPQVTNAGFRGRCHKVGSDRLNRQAVGRFDQMVDEVLQADLLIMWNKIIMEYGYA